MEEIGRNRGRGGRKGKCVNRYGEKKTISLTLRETINMYIVTITWT